MWSTVKKESGGYSVDWSAVVLLLLTVSRCCRLSYAFIWRAITVIRIATLVVVIFKRVGQDAVSDTRGLELGLMAGAMSRPSLRSKDPYDISRHGRSGRALKRCADHPKRRPSCHAYAPSFVGSDAGQRPLPLHPSPLSPPLPFTSFISATKGAIQALHFFILLLLIVSPFPLSLFFV